MSKVGYQVKRVGQAVVTVFAAVTVSFLLVRSMPGGPEAYIRARLAMSVAETGQSSSEVNEAVQRFLLVNPQKPLWEQYVDYLTAILFRFDMGTSIAYNEPVVAIIGDALPWTIFVSMFAILFGTLTFFIVGGILAYYEGKRIDVAGSYFVIFTDSVPYYIVALVLLFLFGFLWDVFPTGGRMDPSTTPGFNLPFMIGVLNHAALPILSFALTAWGGLSFRAHCIRVLGEDYVHVARLRGLNDSRIIFRYIGWNSMLPAYTGVLMGLAGLFGGSVIMEQIFSYRGMGFYVFNAVTRRDLPLMMGGFIIFTVATVLGLLIADLTYGYIDPRASYKRRESFGVDSGQWFSALTAKLSGLRHRGAATTGGGSASRSLSMFDSDDPVETISLRETLYETADLFVLAPLRILWTSPRARAGALIICGFAFVGLVAALDVYPEPRAFQGERFMGPMEDVRFLLGTDNTGSDLLGQMIYATPAMLKMMAAGALTAVGVGSLVGLASGYLGGRIDKVLMTVTDVALNLPGLPLLLILAALFEPRNPYVVGVILAIDNWPGLARQLRSQVLADRSEPYVEVSRAMALPTRTILVRNLLPNLLPLVTINAAGAARGIIFSSAGLYFLGVLPFTNLNWGVMLNLARGSITSVDRIHWLLVPIAAITLMTYGLMLFSQGTDRLYNPRVRARHAKTVDVSSESPGRGDDRATLPSDD